MKHFMSLLLLAGLALPASAQEETKPQTQTLLGGDIESGGYGGVFVHVGQIYNTTGIFVGGQGAWIINHKLAIGGGGYGLVNDITAGKDLDKDLGLNLEFGCGGLMLEYIIASDKLVHLDIHSMIGAGGVTLSNRHYYDKDPFENNYGSDAFFVLEPGIDGILNLSKRVRIGLGATYRYVTGVKFGDISNSDLSGVSGRFVIMFGKF